MTKHICYNYIGNFLNTIHNLIFYPFTNKGEQGWQITVGLLLCPKSIRGVINVAFNYKEQYAVVIMCKDEKEQEQLYNRLKEEGHKLKVVAV